MRKLDCIDGLHIEIEGEIKELKHQDYHGESIGVVIKDDLRFKQPKI